MAVLPLHLKLHVALSDYGAICMSLVLQHCHGSCCTNKLVVARDMLHFACAAALHVVINAAHCVYFCLRASNPAGLLPQDIVLLIE